MGAEFRSAEKIKLHESGRGESIGENKEYQYILLVSMLGWLDCWWREGFIEEDSLIYFSTDSTVFKFRHGKLFLLHIKGAMFTRNWSQLYVTYTKLQDVKRNFAMMTESRCRSKTKVQGWRNTAKGEHKIIDMK